MDCSPLSSSVHGILQVRRLEWVAMLFSRKFSQPRSPALLADSLLFELSRKFREFIEKADSIPPAMRVKV